IGGQAADLMSENTPGDLDSVKYIHTCKTAMMFRAAMRMGALCAQTDQPRVDMLGDYGLKMGLAFQIIDDLLDVTGDPEEMGKQAQKDNEAGKLTYPAVLGIDESRSQAEKLKREAITIIGPLQQAGAPLINLADILVNRKN
ncbi:MAG: polyprenyl synthetase family protein, partial [Sedimentisphaerales bacterium]|nr:polyprenyl synthetase family protein [Sedimentisphaerales bacterium]